jgi:hypothetical protein
MIDENKKFEIYILIEKAANAVKSEDAMRFSQAAANAANTLCALKVALSE